MPPPTIVRFLSRTGADTPKPRTVRPDKARDEFAWNAPFPVAFVVDTTHGVGATLKVPTSPWNRSEGPVPAFRTLCSPIACTTGISVSAPELVSVRTTVPDRIPKGWLAGTETVTSTEPTPPAARDRLDALSVSQGASSAW